MNMCLYREISDRKINVDTKKAEHINIIVEAADLNMI